MVMLYKQNDNVSAYVKEFVAETEADVANLPTDKSEVYPGSTCIVTETSNVYILNPQYQWVKL